MTQDVVSIKKEAPPTVATLPSGPVERACVVCGMGSHRQDWIQASGDAVACDFHTKEEIANALKAGAVGSGEKPGAGEKPPAPDQGLPGSGVGEKPGPGDPHPAHPIVDEPGPVEPPKPAEPKKSLHKY